MKDLKGKVAVVTGAASGIGRALAERFAREGMKLVLADVQEKPLAEACEALTGQGAQAIAVPTDVSRLDAVEALADRAFEAFGAAHVVCNNAGIALGGLSWETSPGEWDWILGVNLRSVVHGVRAFVPRLIAQGEGHVVNTASVAGLLAPPGMSAYCATKHAVVAISECLHQDLALTGNLAKVKVSVLCPGWVRTNITDADRVLRPASAQPAGDPSPAQQVMSQMVRQAVASGMEPAEVADQVLRAIVEERFWILTHPKMKKAVERRLRALLEDRVPEFDPSRM